MTNVNSFIPKLSHLRSTHTVPYLNNNHVIFYVRHVTCKCNVSIAVMQYNYFFELPEKPLHASAKLFCNTF